MQENFKDVEVSGRKFRIKKLDARSGLFMVTKVLGIVSPLLSGVDKKSAKSAKKIEDVGVNYTEMAKGLSSLSEDDFMWIQNKCLSAVSEELPAGLQPVLLTNGNFGVPDLEYDISAVLTLIIHSLVFNLGGFFGGALSGLNLEGLNLSSLNFPI